MLPKLRAGRKSPAIWTGRWVRVPGGLELETFEGLELEGPPLAHFARRLDVVAWWLD